MSESRLVPSNLMTGSRVRKLLPDQKLILYHAWATSPSDAGCFEPDLAGWSGHLSITADALIEALNGFEKISLISEDKETGEIFINDWFRFHKFDSAIRKNMLCRAISKIQSQKLQNLVLAKKAEIDTKSSVIFEKSTSYKPKERKVNEMKSSACKHAEEVPACLQINENEKPQKPKSPNPADRKEKVLVEGVQCWGLLNGKNEEVDEADLILNKIGVEKFRKIVERCIKNGVPEPYLSEFKKELDKEAKAEYLVNLNSCKFNTSKDFEPPAKQMKIREGGLMANIKKIPKEKDAAVTSRI